MIVPSMTVKDIHDELFKDVNSLRDKVENCRKDFKKTVLRSSRYPLTKSYDCKTKEKRNDFVIGFTALKRSNWKAPIIYLYGLYSRPEGKYAASLTLDMKVISIYPPHFFKRYRERIIKDDSISNEDIIRFYFKNDWGFSGAIINKDFESVLHCFESDSEIDIVNFVAATSQGFCFGDKQGDVFIFKTIITEDMLFDDQKPLFFELRQRLLQENSDRYDNKLA